MYYENHEVLGTDKPIYRNKLDGHFTYEDILNSAHSVVEFKEIGFLKVILGGKTLFQPLYQLKN